MRTHAARQLTSLGASAIPARPELLAAFRDDSAEVRAAVARAALYSIPDPPDDDPEPPVVADYPVPPLDLEVPTTPRRRRRAVAPARDEPGDAETVAAGASREGDS